MLFARRQHGLGQKHKAGMDELCLHRQRSPTAEAKDARRQIQGRS